MHRSGTSPITRILNLLGLSLGAKERLMPALEGNNPTGFWEHLDIVQINDELLAYLGGSWDRPPEPPTGWEHREDLTGIRRRARELLDKEFANEPSWGWKDPRTCLTLPFWKTLVPHLKYVICIRNPVDVAKSLEARDDITSKNALGLWSQYNSSALRNTEGEARLFTLYDSYFTDLDRELARLASFVGTDTPDPDSETRRRIVTFLDERLRHHQASDTELVLHNHSDIASTSLYFMFRLPFMSGPNDWDREECDKSLEKVASNHSQHQKMLSDLKYTIADLKESQSQLENQLENISQSRSNLEKQLIATAESRATIEKQLVNASEARANLEKQLAEATESRSTLEKQLVVAAEARASLEQQLSDITDSKSTLEKRLDEEAEARANLERRLAETTESKSTVEEQLNVATEARANLEQRLSDIAESKSTLERQLNEVLTSRSWKVTAPLRAIAQYYRTLIES
jgi:hypothetical protein